MEIDLIDWIDWIGTDEGFHRARAIMMLCTKNEMFRTAVIAAGATPH